MTREELSPKALEMLTAHNLNEVFVTADGQGFTDHQRAQNHASYLKNKRIEHFAKSKEAVVKLQTEDETDKEAQDDDRTALVEKYELLFGKKPAHNIGIEKLKNQIADKEAELAAIEVIQDTTQPATNPAEETEDLKND